MGTHLSSPHVNVEGVDVKTAGLFVALAVALPVGVAVEADLGEVVILVGTHVNLPRRYTRAEASTGGRVERHRRKQIKV